MNKWKFLIKEAEEEAEEIESKLDQARRILGSSKSPQDKLGGQLHKLMVPEYGKGETKGAESIRLINKLVYAYYNDDVKIGRPSSKKGNREDTKEANQAYTYLKRTLSLKDMPLIEEIGSYEDKEYEEFLDHLCSEVVDMLYSDFDRLFK